MICDLLRFQALCCWNVLCHLGFLLPVVSVWDCFLSLLKACRCSSMKTGSLQCCKLMAYAARGGRPFTGLSTPWFTIQSFLSWSEFPQCLLSLIKQYYLLCLTLQELNVFLHHRFQKGQVARISLCGDVCFSYCWLADYSHSDTLELWKGSEGIIVVQEVDLKSQ